MFRYILGFRVKELKVFISVNECILSVLLLILQWFC